MAMPSVCGSFVKLATNMEARQCKAMLRLKKFDVFRWFVSLENLPCFYFRSIWLSHLEHVSHAALGTWTIFTKFEVVQPIFTTDTLCDAVTLTSDPLTLKIYSASAVTWSNYVPNFRQIRQSEVELFCNFNISNLGAVRHLEFERKCFFHRSAAFTIPQYTSLTKFQQIRQPMAELLMI